MRQLTSMSRDRFITNRRSFIKSAAPILLSLATFTRAQTPLERGGFDEKQFPLLREKLLKLVNEERTAAGLNQLGLDELACKVGDAHAGDMVRGQFLNPHHTHVGLGLAYQGRSLRLDELYLARYVQLDPVPQKAKPKSTITLTGKLLNPQDFIHEVDVFYEPLPAPPQMSWLRTPRSLSLPSDYVVLRP